MTASGTVGHVGMWSFRPQLHHRQGAYPWETLSERSGPAGLPRGVASLSNNAATSASSLPALPGCVCVIVCRPIVCRCARRRRPPSAPRHAFAGNRSGSPPRRQLRSGCGRTSNGPNSWKDTVGPHWLPADSHTRGSVFFRTQLRIVALFPRFGPSQLDLARRSPCRRRWWRGVVSLCVRGLSFARIGPNRALNAPVGQGETVVLTWPGSRLAVTFPS